MSEKLPLELVFTSFPDLSGAHVVCAANYRGREAQIPYHVYYIKATREREYTIEREYSALPTTAAARHKFSRVLSLYSGFYIANVIGQ